MNWNSRLAFMSTRVYLSKHTYQTTHEEETPVYFRIQLSRATVKELHSRLQQAYQRDCHIWLCDRVRAIGANGAPLDRVTSGCSRAQHCHKGVFSEECG